VEMASGAISTQGTIIGGDGAAGAYFGYGFQGAGGDGGIGVLLTSGTITNQGLIEGGRGGYALRDAAGAAGVGVEMTTGTVINHGSIRGGYGGYSYNSLAGMGGDGVRFISIGTVSNTGAITGGVGGSSVENVADTPGIGVDLASGGSIANSGAITGGFGGFGAVRTPGGVGVAMSGGGSLTNSGTISGGQGSYSDPAGSQTGAMGGTAIQSNDGAIINRGKIAGGAGGNTSRSLSGVGGTGIAMVSGHLLNKGEITGGSGGANNYFGYGSGGTGVVLVGGGTITNQGTILGGFGSSGGTGIEIGAGTLLNTGLLEGGPGVSTQMYGDNGGTGGVGLLIYAGTTVVSAGTIVGGHGGSSYYTGGNGGVGVDIDGGALRVTGKISGGTPGAGGEGSGGYGAAIQFGAAAATLEVTPSAHFNGDIVANSQVDDTLVLEGKTAGTLSGFGTTITGFRTIDEDASGHWTLAGDIAGEVSLSIGTDATLTLNGIVSIAAVGFDVGGGERLDLDAPMQFTSALSGFGTGDTINLVGLQATSLKYGGHILNLLNAEGSIVETLTFEGKYTQDDFALHAMHGGTEILYAGANDQHEGMSDFLPPCVAPIQDEHGDFGAVLTDFYLVTGFERGMVDVMLHPGQFAAGPEKPT
jgi:hypothetical protein